MFICFQQTKYQDNKISNSNNRYYLQQKYIKIIGTMYCIVLNFVLTLQRDLVKHTMLTDRNRQNKHYKHSD